MTLASPRRRLACRTFSVFAARPLRETRLSFLFRNARWRWCRGRWRLTCGTRPLSDDRVLGFSPFFSTTPFPEYFFFTVFLSMGINVQSGGLTKLTKKESTSSDDDDDDSSELQGKTATAAGVEVRYRVLLFFFSSTFFSSSLTIFKLSNPDRSSQRRLLQTDER